MNKKSNKRLKAVISLGVGVILLTGAVFANYDSASGYTTCKDSLKKILYADNLSIDITAKATVDGSDLYNLYKTHKFNLGGNPSYRSETTTEDNSVNGGESYWYLAQHQDNYDIGKFQNGDSFIYERDPEYYGNEKNLGEQIFGTDDISTSKFIGFAESIGDVLVGDLKNNLVPVSNEDGVRTYSMTLSRDQMPSYVNSGISLMASLIQKSYNENLDTEATNEMDKQMSKFIGSGEPYIKDASFLMTIDKNGNPTKIRGSFNFIGYDTSGGEHVMNLNADFDLYDYGSTEIERFSDEEIKQMKKEQQKRYKTYIDEDESVDAD